MHPENILKGTIIGIILVFVLPITGYYALRLVGYYPYGVSWDVAERIVKKGGSAKDCKKIIQPIAEPMGPSVGEQRAGCIYEYAKLMKDPSACELLMPSSYGLSCVGAAEDFDPCVMLADPEKSVGGQGIDTTYDQCLSGSPATRKHVCCAMARVLYDNKRDCSNFAQGELRDQCHHIVAVKNKELDACGKIVNERNRTGCEVIVRGYLTGRLSR